MSLDDALGNHLMQGPHVKLSALGGPKRQTCQKQNGFVSKSGDARRDQKAKFPLGFLLKPTKKGGPPPPKKTKTDTQVNAELIPSSRGCHCVAWADLSIHSMHESYIMQKVVPTRLASV